MKNDYNFIIIEADPLYYKKNLNDKNKSLNQKLFLSFKNFLNIKKIKFDLSEFEQLDTLSLAKIICVISPLDNVIKQMLLEFDKEEDLCSNLLSVLEIEINNKDNNFKIN